MSAGASPEQLGGFSVSVQRSGRSLVICPSGELDLATCPALEQAVTQALAGVDGGGPREVVLDLNGLEFVDLVGARGIRRCEEIARSHGLRFSATRPRPQAVRLFELCGALISDLRG
jgi:anti-anti-sigma factor